MSFDVVVFAAEVDEKQRNHSMEVKRKKLSDFKRWL